MQIPLQISFDGMDLASAQARIRERRQLEHFMTGSSVAVSSLWRRIVTIIKKAL
jgi:hypothetical protein